MHLRSTPTSGRIGPLALPLVALLFVAGCASTPRPPSEGRGSLEVRTAGPAGSDDTVVLRHAGPGSEIEVQLSGDAQHTFDLAPGRYTVSVGEARACPETVEVVEGASRSVTVTWPVTGPCPAEPSAL